jgi:TonB family protein
MTAAGGARATPIVPSEPPITLQGPEGDYLRALHAQIHFQWATRFVGGNARTRPASDPLNNPALEAEVLFTIRWDGSPAEVTLSKSSGLAAFDRAAVAAVRGERPYPVPPLEVIGDDGVAHFLWRFARDQRLCSGGEVRRREDRLEDALPRLFIQGRSKEALLRVARYMREGDTEAMSKFARAWLARPFSDPVADARAAAALARAGDKRQTERLRRALASPDTVAIAATALAAAKADVCALALPLLKAEGTPGLGMRALREAKIELPATSPCVQALGTMARDEGLKAPVRGEALETLAALDYADTRRLALEELGDSNAQMRAAAARAFGRPGGGRPALYRLQPMLKDPSPEVRAAVASALVRACGDLSFDYLQPLFKERDVEPLVAMAPELGRQSTPGSAALLGKMMKRNVPDLRAAVTAALAARTDPAGRALFQPLADGVKRDQRAPPDARMLVYAAAGTDELLPLARDPVVGILAYKALLKAKRHQEAADWLVASFDRLQPGVLVDAFGAWLANPPGHVAATSPHQ